MKKRTIALWKRLLFRLLLAGAALSFLYVYFFTGVLTIHEYKIEGVPEDRLEELTTDIAYASESKLFHLLPSNRILSYHDDEIRSTIMDVLPNTRSITIYPSGAHQITVKVTHYNPIFSVSDTHAISEEGVMYKEIIPLADFTRLEIASSTKVSKRDLEHLNDLSKRIGTILFPVRTISIDENNDVRFLSDGGRSAAIVSLHADVDTVWSNIVSAIDTEPLRSQLKAELTNLSYLDARFGNKVFYKFTNGQEPAIIPPHEEAATSTATTTVQ